jgi:hypothetical protein
MQLVPFHREHFADKNGPRQGMTKTKSYATVRLFFDQDLTLTRIAERGDDYRNIGSRERCKVFETEAGPEDGGALENVALLA